MKQAYITETEVFLITVHIRSYMSLEMSNLIPSSVIPRYITPLCFFMYRGSFDKENIVIMNDTVPLVPQGNNCLKLANEITFYILVLVYHSKHVRYFFK